jgi:hypothetical protein
VHLPPATNDAVEPKIVQTVGVADAKLTGNPEVADAINASVEFRF